MVRRCSPDGRRRRPVSDHDARHGCFLPSAASLLGLGVTGFRFPADLPPSLPTGTRREIVSSINSPHADLLRWARAAARIFIQPFSVAVADKMPMPSHPKARMAICAASRPSLALTSLLMRWFRQEVAFTMNVPSGSCLAAVFRTRGAALVAYSVQLLLLSLLYTHRPFP